MQVAAAPINSVWTIMGHKQPSHLLDDGILVLGYAGINESKMGTWVAFKLVSTELYQLKDGPHVIFKSSIFKGTETDHKVHC